MIEFAVPIGYKYMLWAAKSQASLIEKLHDTKKPKKNQKYLLYEEKQVTEHPLNSLWPILSLTEDNKHFLANVKPLVLEASSQLQAKTCSFLKAKEEFLLEVYKLGNLINANILPKLLPSDVAKALIWLESKKYEKELTVASLFEIKELEPNVKSEAMQVV